MNGSSAPRLPDGDSPNGHTPAHHGVVVGNGSAMPGGGPVGVVGSASGPMPAGNLDGWPLAKVLVADPDPLLRDLYGYLLTGVASQLIAVEDGIEALRSFVRERPNLVILSADLPRVGAEEVLRRLKSNATASKIPVVIVNSSRVAASGNGHRPGGQPRPDATLTKPFDATEFYETVARLGRRHGVVAASGGSLLMRRQLHFEGYELQQQLRSEPWSATYLAYQRSLRRPAVMKVLALKGAARTEIVEEFRARIRHFAAISHPGLTRVIESGHNDATHFAALQYVQGASLAELMILRELDLAEIHAIADRLLSTLARLHGAGLVLGTLRPDTLIVDQHGSLRVVDFAAIVSEQADHDPGASRSWDPLETLERIAVMGDGDGPSVERDNVRALAILYWLMTGELPALRPAPPSMHGRRVTRALDDIFIHGLGGEDTGLLSDTATLHAAVIDALKRSMRSRDRQRMAASRSHPLSRLLADGVAGQPSTSDPAQLSGDSYV